MKTGTIGKFTEFSVFSEVVFIFVPTCLYSCKAQWVFWGF